MFLHGCCHLVISTHSLTRRLTIIDIKFTATYNISTHSLTRRLTSRELQQLQWKVYFNSQPHKEADGNTKLIKLIRNISTHSLTRRLTGLLICHQVIVLDFNSQPHKEADDPILTNYVDGGSFQLTASQGG